VRTRRLRLLFLAVAMVMGVASLHAARRRLQPDSLARPVARLALWGVITAPASLTADGRYIAIESEAALLPIDTNGCADIYVLDRLTNRLTLESVAVDEGAANGTSRTPRISADGRWLVFESGAHNLMGDDHSVARRSDLYLRDRVAGTTRRLIPADREIDTSSTGYEAAISADGKVVAFTSHTTTLTGGANGGGSKDHPADVLVMNIETGAIVRAGVMANGARPAAGASFAPSLSADGAIVSFTSTADLLGSGSVKLAQPQVYVRDLARGVTRLVSARPNGRISNGASYASSISADGDRVAFVSAASDLGPSDDNHQPDIYVRDLDAGVITLVSRTPQGKAGNGSSLAPAMSADGQFVTFSSSASDLLCSKRCSPEEADNNLLPDIFLADLRDRAGVQLQRVSGGADGAWWTASLTPSIDAHGRVVVFASREPISPRDLAEDFDLFAWIREAAAGSP
jgi:TolB protein